MARPMDAFSQNNDSSFMFSLETSSLDMDFSNQGKVPGPARILASEPYESLTNQVVVPDSIFPARKITSSSMSSSEATSRSFYIKNALQAESKDLRAHKEAKFNSCFARIASDTYEDESTKNTPSSHHAAAGVGKQRKYCQSPRKSVTRLSRGRVNKKKNVVNARNWLNGSNVGKAGGNLQSVSALEGNENKANLFPMSCLEIFRTNSDILEEACVERGSGGEVVRILIVQSTEVDPHKPFQGEGRAVAMREYDWLREKARSEHRGLYDASAASLIFHLNNRGRKWDAVDLQGLSIKEVEIYLLQYLKNLKNTRGINSGDQITILVGDGVVGYHGLSRLGYAVHTLCTRLGFTSLPGVDIVGITWK